MEIYKQVFKTSKLSHNKYTYENIEKRNTQIKVWITHARTHTHAHTHIYKYLPL